MRTPCILLALSLLFNPLLPSSSSISIEFPITYSNAATLPLVTVKIGTPPQTLSLYPDTSSDTSWVFCDSFDRSRSSSFQWLYEPGSPSCDTSVECYDWDPMQFTAEYEDGSSATGDWAMDTITARSSDGSNVAIHGVAIGCSDRNLSNFSEADGVLALSRNSPSFARQMVNKFGNGPFSYVLRDGDRLAFGETNRDDFSRDSMQYIRLVSSNTSLFYAEISGLTLGDEELGIPKEIWTFDACDESGGVIFDTGSTMTYLPEVAFHAIVDKLMEMYGNFMHFKMRGNEVCFAPYTRDIDGVPLPELAIKFEGGGRFVPKAEHLYYRDRNGMTCLNVWPMEHGDGSIIGSLLQRGYYWEFDLSSRVVGFAPLVDNRWSISLV